MFNNKNLFKLKFHAFIHCRAYLLTEINFLQLCIDLIKHVDIRISIDFYYYSIKKSIKISIKNPFWNNINRLLLFKVTYTIDLYIHHP